MWTLARSNLLKERTRLLISVGGVAFAVMLMVLLRGLYVSYQHKVGAYFEHVGADVWVLQEGTADFFYSFSLVPDQLIERLAEVNGVDEVHPYLARQVSFEHGGSQMRLYVAGFDPSDPVTGPIEMVEGSADVGADGIVIDEVFAAEADVQPGDSLTINGVDLTVRGLSSGGDVVVFQYAFVRTDTARLVLDMGSVNNALLLDLDDSTAVADIAERIGAAGEGLILRTTEEVVIANEQIITGTFLPVIAALLVIGFLVGVAVIGLTIYSAVLEKRREFGVLKAIGSRTGQMLQLVAIQAVLSAMAGYLLGVGLAVAASLAADRWVPAFTTQLTISDIAWFAIVTAAMAALAAVVPMARISNIDPAEVFRS